VITNARMYSLAPAAGQSWQRLLAAIAETAGVPLTYLEHKPPAPISELWGRQDMGAVFMCGLPYARSVPRPAIVAAPVPSPPAFEGQPRYWSELVVRADSRFDVIEDTFGHRIALTAMESQSGCLAALYYLMAAGGSTSLYREVIEPRVTPLGAMTAVIEGLADVAPIDSYALSLAQRYMPELTSQLRTVARTLPTAIPPIVSSRPVPPSLESAFLEAHKNTSMAPLMADLQLERFVRPDLEAYDVLKRRFDAAITFWRQHPFACSVHPAFAELATGPLPGTK
jgi:ABC-type phosphate/phosphonate transport system substrate-binding protein